MKKELKKIDLLTNNDVEEINTISNKITKRSNVLLYITSALCLIFLLSIVFIKNVSSISMLDTNTYIMLVLLLVFVLIFLSYKMTKISKEEKNLDKINEQRKYYNYIDFTTFITNIIVIFGFILLFIVTPAKISGDSMEGSYQDGDTILVWNLFYNPNVNDVVIVDITKLKEDIKLSDTNMYNHLSKFDSIIKRVVAVSGDTISYKNGYLHVNDKSIQEVSSSEYIKFTSDRTNMDGSTDDYIIPKDKYLVLGDNRNNSTDSRGIGLINKSEIVGVSIFRIAPFSSIGIPGINILY